jgi:DNA-directed RNA polymerase subunit RPC12/RpoP
MLMTIKCPKCGVEGKMSLIESHYKGPYKCWSCKAFFNIEMDNGAVTSCVPLSTEDYNRLYPPKHEDFTSEKTRFQRPIGR